LFFYAVSRALYYLLYLFLFPGRSPVGQKPVQRVTSCSAVFFLPARTFFTGKRPGLPAAQAREIEISTLLAVPAGNLFWC
jgi:hypothetical protein